jgi:pimeloyl-ACP methyl ester carboxylesterase
MPSRTTCGAQFLARFTSCRQRCPLKLPVGTIVVVGKEDRVTPVHLSHEIQNRVPESKLHVIPDCEHLPPIEKPHHLAALLSAFMMPGH